MKREDTLWVEIPSCPKGIFFRDLPLANLPFTNHHSQFTLNYIEFRALALNLIWFRAVPHPTWCRAIQDKRG
jgi:hypothetical protein